MAARWPRPGRSRRSARSIAATRCRWRRSTTSWRRRRRPMGHCRRAWARRRRVRRVRRVQRGHAASPSIRSPRRRLPPTSRCWCWPTMIARTRPAGRRVRRLRWPPSQGGRRRRRALGRVRNGRCRRCRQEGRCRRHRPARGGPIQRFAARQCRRAADRRAWRRRPRGRRAALRRAWRRRPRGRRAALRRAWRRRPRGRRAACRRAWRPRRPGRRRPRTRRRGSRMRRRRPSRSRPGGWGAS